MRKLFNQKPSVIAFATLLICLENSFWHQSETVSFMDAFCKAHELYVNTGTREKVETALQELGPDNLPRSRKSAFRTVLSGIVLKYRLPRPDSPEPSN